MNCSGWKSRRRGQLATRTLASTKWRARSSSACKARRTRSMMKSNRFARPWSSTKSASIDSWLQPASQTCTISGLTWSSTMLGKSRNWMWPRTDSPSMKKSRKSKGRTPCSISWSKKSKGPRTSFSSKNNLCSTKFRCPPPYTQRKRVLISLRKAPGAKSRVGPSRA